jgi:hypothetical protein
MERNVELSKATNEEVVAYWNILQWQLRSGLEVEGKVNVVVRELTIRGIPCKSGKRIVTAK